MTLPGGGAARWAAAVIVVGAGVCLWLSLPGHLSYDSVVQLAEGRNGAYGLSGHPPVMSWLLGLADTVVPGPSLFVVFQTALIAGGLASLVLLGRPGNWLTVILAAAVAATPQLLIYPAIVWKDVLFAGAATAGFACLAHAAAAARRGAARHALVGAALGLLTLAAMTRQNGAVVLPFGALAAAWSGARAAPAGRRWRGAALGGAFLAIGLAIMTVGATALTAPAAGPPTAAAAGQFGNLQTYDIVRALVLEPRTRLRVMHARAPWFESLLRTRGVAAYSPVRIDSLEPVMEIAGAHADSAALIGAQWMDMFARDPWLYLRGRAEAFRWVVFTPSQDDCVLIFTGVEGPVEEMGDVQLTPRKSSMDLVLEDYAMNFAGTPVFSHASYAVLGAVLLIGLLRRRLASDIAVAAMLGSAFAFTAAFAVISIACDYRYLYDLDLAAIAATLYAASTWGMGADKAKAAISGPRPDGSDRTTNAARRAG